MGIIAGDVMVKTATVASYYDQVTRWFLAGGVSRRLRAIHRAVYLVEYVHVSPHDTVHELLVHVLQAHSITGAVADIGCGVGASMDYVAQRLGATVSVSGVTISTLQAHIAHRDAVIVASFDHLPYADASVAAVWAIESYAHSTSPATFWSEVARVLKPGGLCILCDDMRATAQASPYIDGFQHGWIVPNIATRTVHSRYAADVNMHELHARDLSEGLRIRVLPDVLTMALIEFLPRVQHCMVVRSLIGSIALQTCYQRGQMRYQFMVYQKHA